jgi:hypothetical protein
MVTVGLAAAAAVGNTPSHGNPTPILARFDARELDRLVMTGCGCTSSINDKSTLLACSGYAADGGRIVEAISHALRLLARAGLLDLHRYRIVIHFGLT